MMQISFNRLTPSEVERLAILAEEAGEVIQAVGKILRHGYESLNPEDWKIPYEPETNRGALERELGDLLHSLKTMTDANDLSFSAIERRKNEKAERTKPYLHHQDD